MPVIELWPWGLLIISALSIMIGWLIKDLVGKRIVNSKDAIIRAQEREYVKLAQKHVESRESDKQILNQLEERLASLKKQTKEQQPSVVMKSSSQEDKELISELHDELDRMRIENQKFRSVPKAMFVEKNKALKSEIKQLRKKLKGATDRNESLEVEKKRLRKKMKKQKKGPRREVKIVETIDFKKLKKLLKDIPVKRSRVTIYSGKKEKKGDR